MRSRLWLRRSRAGTLVAGACVALAACQDAEIMAPKAAAPAATPAALSDPLAQRVADLGFRTDMIVDEGDHFRVEGDIIIAKDALTGPRQTSTPGGPVFQWHTNELVAQTKMAQGLRVDLSGISGNSAWLTAAREAMARWNWTTDTKIQLVEGSPADISFSFAYLPSGTLAQASFPTSGSPGGTITISPNYNSLSSSRKLWVVVHEIGHTLGYRHSNWDELNEEYATNHYTVGVNQIPGTPYSDPNSVMTGGVGSRSWAGFSNYDAVANRYLYPISSPQISLYIGDEAGNVSFYWGGLPDVSYYRITYEYWYEYFEYDPTYPGDGYYRPVSGSYEVGTTTGTSFSSGPQGTEASPYPCAYYVTAVYPSGKHGGYARGQDVAC